MSKGSPLELEYGLYIRGLEGKRIVSDCIFENQGNEKFYRQVTYQSFLLEQLELELRIYA